MINSCDLGSMRKYIWNSEPDSNISVRIQLMDINFSSLVNIIMLTDLAKTSVCEKSE